MEKTAGAKLQTKYNAVTLGKYALSKGLYILFGWLCGICTLPFGATPFGFALLCASGKSSIFVYAGLIISAFTGFELTQALLFFGIYSAVLLLRVLTRLTLDFPLSRREKHPIRELVSLLFSESLGYRILIALVGATAFSLCTAISNGLLYYYLVGLLFNVLLAPLTTFLFYCFFEKQGLWQNLGLLSLCAVAVYAASPLKLYGMSLAVAGGLFLVFYICEHKGFVWGLLVSAVMGLVYSPTLAPIFIFAAMSSGVFLKISPSLMCISTFISGVAWGYFVRGIGILDGLFAGLLSACLLYSVIHKLYIRTDALHTSTPKSASCPVLDSGELDSVRLYEMNRRMCAISDGLERLSGFFEELKLKFPKYGELLRICRDAFESSCVGCPDRASCPHEQTELEIRSIASLLEQDRRVEYTSLSRDLCNRCSRLPDIIDEINYNSGARSSRTENVTFAPDYKALSRLLTKSLETESAEYIIDSELSLSLCSALGGFEDIIGAFVYGKRRRTAYVKAKSVEYLHANKEALLHAICQAMPFEPNCSAAEIRRGTGGGILCVWEAERFRVSFTSRQCKARTESEFCGDSLTLFRNNDSRFFALISDGMGTGRDAAAISQICSGFICSMLDTGKMNEELLEWLNGFLCGRCEGSFNECSATVDLMELDLISGSASFFKSGAAATYVWHSGGLLKLRCRTMPIGILDKTDSKRFDLPLSSGDAVIMISDGVCGNKEECPWLFDLLRQNMDTSSPERTADLIVKYAIGHGSDDDISVAIIKVL